MSTRTNIVIERGDSRVYMYRHCDGYPAETGADLLQKLQDAAYEPAMVGRGLADKLLRAMFEDRYAATSYRPAAQIYELTDSLHGDIEYAYFVRFEESRRGGGEEATVAVVAFNPCDDSGTEPARIAGRVYMPLAALVERVNADRRESNRRAAERGLEGRYSMLPESYGEVSK